MIAADGDFAVIFHTSSIIYYLRAVEFLRKLFGRKKTVLVIDDEPIFLETTIMALQRRGYKALRALNGRDGLALALSARPHLVVLDIRMPGGIDGWDVLAAVRSAKSIKTMPVLMLTTINQTGDINKSFELGASGYIIKPLDTAKLYRKVEALIGLP